MFSNAPQLGTPRGKSLVPAAGFCSVFGYAVLVALVLIGIAEGVARVGLRTYRLRKMHAAGLTLQCRGGSCGENVWVDLASASTAYDGYPWAEDYWREERVRYRAMKYIYAPFRLWQAQEWHARYFNVDSTPTGNWRRTQNVSAGCDAGRKLVVWVFGGSAAWGSWVPDSDTMPSYLSAKLGRLTGRCAEVHNFAVEAYVSNQEVITLIDLLKSGGRPDAVVFYDGFNDAECDAYSAGVASAHCELAEIKEKLESRSGWRMLLADSSAVEAARGFLRHVEPRKQGELLALGPQNEIQQARLTPGEIQRRADAVAENYRANVKLLRQLGADFGFQVYFFWQPTLYYGGKPMVPFEQATMQFLARQPQASQAIQAVYRRIEEQCPAAGCVSLAHIFDHSPEPLYLDYVHLGPKGNEMVAAAIAAAMKVGN